VTQAEYTLQPMTYGNLLSQRRSNASSFYHFDALGSADRPAGYRRAPVAPVPVFP
jgi:hypothetical protein